jgi:hypothetical protein
MRAFLSEREESGIPSWSHREPPQLPIETLFRVATAGCTAAAARAFEFTVVNDVLAGSENT